MNLSRGSSFHPRRRIYGISACLLAPDLQTLLLLCDMGAIYGARVVSWWRFSESQGQRLGEKEQNGFLGSSNSPIHVDSAQKMVGFNLIQPTLRNPALMMSWNSLWISSKLLNFEIVPDFCLALGQPQRQYKFAICWFLSEAADDMGQNLIAPKMDGKCNEPTD